MSIADTLIMDRQRFHVASKSGPMLDQPREQPLFREGELVWTRGAHSKPIWRMGIVIDSGSYDRIIDDDDENSIHLAFEYLVEWENDGVTYRGSFAPSQGVIKPNTEQTRRFVEKTNPEAVKDWEHTAEKLVEKRLRPRPDSPVGVARLRVYGGFDEFAPSANE